MLHEIAKTYADAWYVATTLRPPIAPRQMWENKCFIGRESERRVKPFARTNAVLAALWRTLLGRTRGPTGKRTFLRAPYF